MKFKEFTYIFRVLALLMCCIAGSMAGFAASFKPVVTNYTTKDYGAGMGIQNWSLSQSENGEIYVGNNKGLLIYDGYFWKQVAIPGRFVIRSLYVLDEKIYVGSYEEFGYFQKDGNGALNYKSLSAPLKKSEMVNEEIWNIWELNGVIYFQSFNSYFTYDGKTVKRWYNSGKRPLYFHKLNGKLYAQMIGKGYFLFDGRNFNEIIPYSVLKDNVVAAMGMGDDKAILCTETSGLYRLNGTEVSRFETEVDSKLSRFKINRAVMTQDSLLIVGTILDGIYAIGLDGKLRWRYNIENGLNNNSVLGLFCDRRNNVWAALDNGVALIHTGSEFSIMMPERGEDQLGMIYDVDIHGNDMYLATNQGFYRYDFLTGNIHLVDGTGGQNWHVSTFGNQTFVGHNTQTLELENGNVVPVSSSRSSSTSMVLCHLNGEDVILESSYSELRVYRKHNGRWAISGYVDGFSAPVRQLEVDQSGTVWAANMNVGIYRIELNRDLTKVTNMHYFRTLDGDDATTNYVMKIRGRIVFSGGGKLYTYDDISGEIVPYKDLNDVLSLVGNIHSSTPVTDNLFWLSGEQEYVQLKFENGNFKRVRYIPVDFFGLQNNENNGHVFVQDDDMVYFNLNNAVARCRIGKSSKDKRFTPKLIISSVYYQRGNGDVVSLPVSNDGNESVNTEGSVTFLFSFPNFEKDKIRFHYRLTGADEIEQQNQEPMVVFSNLSYGDYTLQADAIDERGEVVSTVTYKFTVSRPAYLSVYAILIYVIVLGIGIFFYSKWHTNKALEKRKKEYEVERDKQNIKMLEQEKLIAQQQQQLLESELSSKSKELANLALDMYAKEQIIESLKDSITQKQQGSMSQKDMEALLKKFESGTSNLEFWSIYQKNFDMIHNHFFQKLRDRYPSLTASDLKFCALLRLNLSTKDIAKVTNLTIRGVEAARYRLRKKFDLPEKKSLIEFLIDFK